MMFSVRNKEKRRMKKSLFPLVLAGLLLSGCASAPAETTTAAQTAVSTEAETTTAEETTPSQTTTSEPAETDPEQADESEAAADAQDEDDVIMIDTSIKRIDEYFNDYFMLDNGVFCSNISGKSSWRDHTFTKGDYFGEILSSTEERDLKKIEPWAANVLPVGTKLYNTKEPGGVIVAEVDGELIPYLEIREG